MIDFVEHLYKNNIIHRDIRPPNVMIGRDNNLRLIDFGFAYRFEENQDEKNLPVEGATTFAGIDFLTEYSNIMQDPQGIAWHNYKRNFDLFCAINVITYMINEGVRNEINTIHSEVKYRKTKEYSALQIWILMQNQNRTYDELLKSTRNLSMVSDFAKIKSILQKNFNNLQMIYNTNYDN